MIVRSNEIFNYPGGKFIRLFQASKQQKSRMFGASEVELHILGKFEMHKSILTVACITFGVF